MSLSLPAATSASATSAQSYVGDYAYPSVSADGRYVAYARLIWSPLAGVYENESIDLFERDMATGAVRLVATSTADGSPDSNSMTSVSADGRYVAYTSKPSPYSADNTYNVYVKDMVNGAVRLVSCDSTGVQGNAQSNLPSISSDGRYIAFASSASNLAPGATSLTNIFVKDMKTGTTTVASSDSSGALVFGSCALRPSISGDGRYVAFTAYPKAGPRIGRYNVCVKDTRTGMTWTESSDSIYPSMSADGNHVAYNYMSGNLLMADIPTGTMSLVCSVTAGGAAGVLPGGSSVSSDGRYVAFITNQEDVAPGGAPGHQQDAFVKDMTTGAITRASTDSSGKQGNGPVLSEGAMSANGRYVAFVSQASDLVPGGTPSYQDNIYLKDMITGQTRLVSAVPGSASSPYTGLPPTETSPTVVLIGGLWSNYGGFDSAHAPDSGNEWHDTYNYLTAAGYNVLIPPESDKSNAPSNTIESMNGFIGTAAYRLDKWLGQQHLAPGTPVVLVGHSQGGLISRFFAENRGFKRPESQVNVIGIYQIDTPNLGSPMATVLRNAWIGTGAEAGSSLSVLQLEQGGSTIKLFNSALCKTTSVPTRHVASDFFPVYAETQLDPHMTAWGFSQLAAVNSIESAFNQADNDGLVSVDSAEYAPAGKDSGSLLVHALHGHHLVLDTVGGDLHGLWPLADCLPPNTNTSTGNDVLADLTSFIAKVSAGASPTHPTESSRRAPASRHAVATPIGRRLAAASADDLDLAPGWRTSGEGDLTLSSASTSLVPFSVEGTTASIALSSGAGTPTLSVTASGGASVACAAATSSGHTAGGIRVTPGRYVAHVGLSGASDANASFSVLDGGSTELRVRAPAQVSADGPFTIEAGVYEHSTRRTGGTFTASVGSGAPVTLKDDGVAPDTVAGDGVFVGSLSAPATGSADVAVHASGTDAEGHAFTRIAHAFVSVAVPRASFNGGFAWHTTAGTSGKANALLFEVGLHASEDCTLNLAGVVGSGEHTAARPSTLTTLLAGSDTTVTLSLNPDELQSFDTTGDFTLSSVDLLDETDGLLTSIDSTTPALSGVLAPADVEYVHCSLGLEGSAPTSATTVMLAGEAVCTTEPIGGVELSFDDGATWYGAPAPDGGWGSNDATYACAFTLPEGAFGVTSRALDATGDPIPGASGQCYFSVDRTSPDTTATVARFGVSDKATVTLSSDDATGTGVAATYYSVDGGALKPYSVPFSVVGFSTHKVRYFSVDAAGNVESTHTSTVAISKPIYSTALQLSGLASVKSGKSYKLSGTITHSATGKVRIVWKRYYSGEYHSIKTVYATLSHGRFSASYKPRHTGKWRVYVSYAGNTTSLAVFKAARTVYKSFGVK